MWDSGQLKQKVIALFEEREELHPLPGEKRFAEVYLPMEDEGTSKIAPKADFAARCNETYLYVEVDTGEGVSHNVAKYFYVLNWLETKPKRVLIFHILGPGFRVSERNYLFHRKLASFVAQKIENAFRDEFEFHYEQSEPFLKIENAVDWLSKGLSEFSR